ncbi:prolyl-tRNA synthetase [Bacillus thuringiensis]|uniref:prolyl-tRNA synthetase associated domain-containing protein n=1 Tax=Bacillus cereus group TaxID=86661 RepID=UPI001374BD1D|nr:MULTISPECIES: prolyl-tRNA synthetase associated domain-containing protein [Bacillus cereus group]MBG9467636.1 prolyl-tRNA synthetase [Bacillus thuringiensis]
MFYISEVNTIAPIKFSNPLQEEVYLTLRKMNIPFQRVDTDEAITMDDCTLINEKLNMKMVKTLFLCNRQQTTYYLFITRGDKPFRSKDFSSALNITRVSFAPEELMKEMLGTKIGAATVFSALLDKNKDVQIVFDKDVTSEEWYGCSDGTTTGYMKVKTEKIINNFLSYTNHEPLIIGV